MNQHSNFADFSLFDDNNNNNNGGGGANQWGSGNNNNNTINTTTTTNNSNNIGGGREPPPSSVPRVDRPPSAASNASSTSSARPRIDIGLAPHPGVMVPPSVSSPSSCAPDGGSSSAAAATAASMGIHLPPRANWSVSDANLQPVPPLYPPLNRQCTTYVSDASPSVVAIRIAECLRKRSISTEYDDEAATATGMTVDRVRLIVRLFRGGKGLLVKRPEDADTAAAGGGHHGAGAELDAALTTEEYAGQGGEEPSSLMPAGSYFARPDFSYGVIVECQRFRGDSMSFHRTCRAILACARGDSDGMDDQRGARATLYRATLSFPSRPPPLGGSTRMLGTILRPKDSFPHLVPLTPGSPAATRRVAVAETDENPGVVSLEHAQELIKKDRVDAQQLGMESLVLLTTVRSSGMDTAQRAAVAILGVWNPAPGGGHDVDGNPFADIHEWVYRLVKDRCIPNSTGVGGGADRSGGMQQQTSSERTSQHSLSSVEHRRLRRGEAATRQDDANHLGTMRGLALLALSNALTIVVDSGGRGHYLRTILRDQSPHLVELAFLASLVEDLTGAARPPSAAQWDGARFSSAHDAALSAICIRHLVGHSNDARQSLLTIRGSTGHSVLDDLDRAKVAGMATHLVLEREASHAYVSLLGDETPVRKR